MLNEDKLDLGAFEVLSGKLIVSDPCYAEELWCCEALETVHNGTWNACVVYDGDPNYPRVASLIVEHAASSWRPVIMEEAAFSVGVDSGQAGFFDAAHYRNERVIDPQCTPTEHADLWYDHCCQITLARQQAGVLPYGVVSSSGLGDGCYDCYIQRDAFGYLIRAEILFIDTDACEMEDDDDANE